MVGQMLPGYPTRMLDILWATFGASAALAAALQVVAGAASPFLLFSLGGSTVFLFALTGSESAQPRALIGGHLGAAVIGILCYQAFGDGIWVSVTAVVLTMAFMMADALIGRKLSIEALEKHLMLAKAELKEHNAATDDLKVELSDSNRPDLWSAEGLARQIRSMLTGKADEYPFFRPGRKATRVIRVSKDMQQVRPYIAACTAQGLRMNDDVLTQMIQSQDKLAEIFGRKRSTVSIGIYELDKIMFPVEYRPGGAGRGSFTPLGMEEKLTLGQILERHPKGIQYGGIVKPFKKYPVLLDSMRHVLSFPPIIQQHRDRNL